MRTMTAWVTGTSSLGQSFSRADCSSPILCPQGPAHLYSMGKTQCYLPLTCESSLLPSLSPQVSPQGFWTPSPSLPDGQMGNLMHGWGGSLTRSRAWRGMEASPSIQEVEGVCPHRCCIQRAELEETPPLSQAPVHQKGGADIPISHQLWRNEHPQTHRCRLPVFFTASPSVQPGPPGKVWPPGFGVCV